MYSVTYHRATSLEEASAMAGEGDVKLLSGGMTLIPAMKTRLAAPAGVVDISRLDSLKGIDVTGKSVTIGAGATHFEIAGSAELARVCPALTYMASHIGDPHVRYKGTIGGSIANNDPAADYPSALLAMNATVVTNQREIQAEKFFTGLFETALEEGEIVTAVRFTAPEKSGYEKFRNPASRYAITGVFVAKTGDDIRVGVAGAGDDGVFRSREIEKALTQSFDASALENVTVPSGSLMTDMHASADYRANLIVVMAKRAVKKALATA